MIPRELQFIPQFLGKITALVLSELGDMANWNQSKDFFNNSNVSLYWFAAETCLDVQQRCFQLRQKCRHESRHYIFWQIEVETSIGTTETTTQTTPVNWKRPAGWNWAERNGWIGWIIEVNSVGNEELMWRIVLQSILWRHHSPGVKSWETERAERGQGHVLGTKRREQHKRVAVWWQMEATSRINTSHTKNSKTYEATQFYAKLCRSQTDIIGHPTCMSCIALNTV